LLESQGVTIEGQKTLIGGCGPVHRCGRRQSRQVGKRRGGDRPRKGRTRCSPGRSVCHTHGCHDPLNLTDLGERQRSVAAISPWPPIWDVPWKRLPGASSPPPAKRSSTMSDGL
jgi:hypothetical protein